MKIRALTIKPHGSHSSLPTVQRLQPFLRQLRAPRLWLRKSHCARVPSSLPYNMGLYRDFRA